MAVNKKIRFEVFKRDKFTCQYCGKSAPDVILHADHIHPKSKGGADDITNLITSCFDCNMGKKDRTLDDSTAIEKRKKQLDDLQDRREQLEMMMQWHRGLSDIEDEAIQQLSEFWSDLTPGYSLNESGKASLSQWIRRFGVNKIAEAMRISTSQYLEYDYQEETVRPTKQSVEKAFSYLPKICSSQEKMDKKPYLKDLYYVRGILKNRGIVSIHTQKEWQCIEIMEAAVLSGADIEAIKDAAKTVNNYSQFETAIKDITIGEAF